MNFALVTGGSRGIGRAVALRLARMGYKIIINYQSNNAAAEETLALIREAGQDELGRFNKLDLTPEERQKILYDNAAELLKKIGA